MKWLTLGLLILLTGCEEQKPPLLQKRVLIDLEIIDDFPGEPDVLGRAWYAGGFCTVKIRESHFPQCVDHEVEHCFRGNWHEGYETDLGCRR